MCVLVKKSTEGKRDLKRGRREQKRSMSAQNARHTFLNISRCVPLRRYFEGQVTRGTFTELAAPTTPWQQRPCPSDSSGKPFCITKSHEKG